MIVNKIVMLATEAPFSKGGERGDRNPSHSINQVWGKIGIMPFADSAGCRIYYRLEGSPAKPLLVLVHALGTDHCLWDPQMPALLNHFQVLRPDLRGHGASNAPAGEYTLEQLSADVLAAAMQRYFSGSTLASGNPVCDTIRITFLNTSAAGYAGCCAAIRDMDHLPLLASIQTPVLVIGSDCDLSTPWTGHGELIAARIPGARTAKLETAHLSNLEDPAAFTAALLAFLLP
jgi:pimeloyl-ACP methyl ester carboxylesterase